MDKFNEPTAYFEEGMKYKRLSDECVFECVWSGVKNAVLRNSDNEEYFAPQSRRDNYTVYTPSQTITMYLCVYNTPSGLHFGDGMYKTREAAQEAAAHYCNVIYPGTWFVLDIIPVTYTTTSE